MANDSWRAPVSGLWSDPDDWSDGAVPGPSDDALIEATGSSYTVTVNAAETASALTLGSPDATLAVDALLALTKLDLSAGTIDLAAAGTLATADASLGVATIDGPGTLTTKEEWKMAVETRKILAMAPSAARASKPA